MTLDFIFLSPNGSVAVGLGDRDMRSSKFTPFSPLRSPSTPGLVGSLPLMRSCKDLSIETFDAMFFVPTGDFDDMIGF